MKTPPYLILRRAHQRDLWAGPLWLVAGALGLEVVASRLGADLTLRILLCAAGLVAAIVVRLAYRPSLRDTARSLDSLVPSLNRFEALAEVADRTDPLSTAIEREAAQFLSGISLPRPYGWYAAFALMAALALAQVLTSDSLPKPTATGRVASLAPPSTANQFAHVAATRPEIPVPAASLRWLSPEPNIEAEPTENVSMEAEGASATGLERFILHVSVNGDAQPPQSIPDALRPGKATLALILTLSRFPTAPHQLVTYYLSAKRTIPKGQDPATLWPEVVSPLQMIQIRGTTVEFSSRTGQATGMGEFSKRLSSALQKIEREEEETLSQAFLLAHPTPNEDASRLHAALAQLAAKQQAITQEIRDALTSADAQSMPADLRSRLSEAAARAAEAATALAKLDPTQAALAIEKSLAGVLPAKDAALKGEKNADASQSADQSQEADSKTSPPADITQTQLVKLAAAERALADNLSQSRTDTGVFSKQYGLAQELAKLGAGDGISSDIKSDIQEAAKEAEEAARQLNAGDSVAAKEPAERAAMDLNQATQGLASNAKQGVTDILSQVQRLLILAAHAVKSPEKTSAGAQKALDLTQQARGMLTKGARRLLQEADIKAAKAEAKDAQSGGQSDYTNPDQEGHDAIASFGSGPSLEDSAKQLSDMDDEIGASHIEGDLQVLILAGAAAEQRDKDAAAKKLLDLANEIALRISALGNPGSVASQALKNLRKDSASAKSATSAAALQKIQTDATAEEMVAQAAAAAGGQNLDPSPGPVSGSQQGANAGASTPGGSSNADQATGQGTPTADGASTDPGGQGQGSSGDSSAQGAGQSSGSGQGSDTGNQESNSGSQGQGSSGNAQAKGAGKLSDKSSAGHGGGSGLFNPHWDTDGPPNPNSNAGPILSSATRHDISAIGTPNATPDDLGTGHRVNSGVSKVQTTDPKAPNIYFAPGSKTPTESPEQSTVGKQMSAADILSQKINAVADRLQIYLSQNPRANELTTADSSQAPPDYREAVAGYFEALAKAPPKGAQPSP